MKDESYIPPQRVENKSGCAEWFGVSMSAVEGWIRRGCPCLQRGKRGTEWQFDLLEVCKWRSGGLEKTGEEPDDMRPKDRLDWYRGEMERLKLLRETGELVPAIDFEGQLASALKIVAVSLESLPDVLERDAGIRGAAVERCQEVIDRVREELYLRLSGGENET